MSPDGGQTYGDEISIPGAAERDGEDYGVSANGATFDYQQQRKLINHLTTAGVPAEVSIGGRGIR